MDVGIIFGMLVAIIVITLVFVFGFQQLTSLQDIQNSAEMIKAKDNLKVAVERVYGGGGDSSEKIRLSFPQTVRKVCFMPVYYISYSGERTPYDGWRLVQGLVDQELAKDDDAAETIVGMRIHPDKNGDEVDDGQALLVFFYESAAPAWYEVPHLEPGEMEDEDGNTYILCTGPRETLWLQRKYDRAGAWVDVEEE